MSSVDTIASRPVLRKNIYPAMQSKIDESSLNNDEQAVANEVLVAMQNRIPALIGALNKAGGDVLNAAIRKNSVTVEQAHKIWRVLLGDENDASYVPLYSQVEAALMQEACTSYPSISSLDNPTVAQGKTTTITISGANLPDNPQVEILTNDDTSDDKVTVSNIALGTSGAVLIFTITVAEDAAEGPRTVKVYAQNYPSLWALKPNALEITAGTSTPSISEGPVITSPRGNPLPPIPGETVTVTFSGDNLQRHLFNQSTLVSADSAISATTSRMDGDKLQFDLTIPDDIAPGTYELQLKKYDAGTIIYTFNLDIYRKPHPLLQVPWRTSAVVGGGTEGLYFEANAGVEIPLPGEDSLTPFLAYEGYTNPLRGLAGAAYTYPFNNKFSLSGIAGTGGIVAWSRRDYSETETIPTDPADIEQNPESSAQRGSTSSFSTTGEGSTSATTHYVAHTTDSSIMLRLGIMPVFDFGKGVSLSVPFTWNPAVNNKELFDSMTTIEAAPRFNWFFGKNNLFGIVVGPNITYVPGNDDWSVGLVGGIGWNNDPAVAPRRPARKERSTSIQTPSTPSRAINPTSPENTNAIMDAASDVRVIELDPSKRSSEFGIEKGSSQKLRTVALDKDVAKSMVVTLAGDSTTGIRARITRIQKVDNTTSIVEITIEVKPSAATGEYFLTLSGTATDGTTLEIKATFEVFE